MNTRFDEITPKVWMVNESDPWPEAYIAIIFGAEDQLGKILKKDQKLFFSLSEALNRAKDLKIKYSVKQIRIFYPNQGSIIVK